MKPIYLHLPKVRGLRTLVVITSIALLSAASAEAQYTVGEPVAANASGTLASVDSYIDVYNATSSYSPASDICLRIQSVYNNASLIPPGGSATVDARGFTNTNAPTGGWVCSVDPFAITGSTTTLVGKSGKLLLGYVDIPAEYTWVIPGHIIIEGIGTNGTGLGGANTIIHASSSPAFQGWPGSGSTYPAVLQMWLGGTSPGSQAATYGIQIRNLTVDCNNQTNCVGIFNNNAEEGSLVYNVQIFDAPLFGLHVTTNNPNSTGYGAVNSGPYQDIFINYTSACTSCGTSTIPLQIDGSTTNSTTGEGRSIRGFDNFTVSGNNLAKAPATLIYVFGVSTTITNSHAEYCYGSSACIQIGEPGTPSYSTYGVKLSDVTVSNNSVSMSGYDVIIAQGTSTYPTGNILVENLNHESINSRTIMDDVTTNVVPDNYVGWYFLGAATGSNPPAVFTSSSDMTSSGTPYELKVPGDVDIIGTFSKPAGSFKIDHPLDPANQYLYHSFVESPDMMNIYNGSVITDKHGFATVTLPDYFEALNQDFRYQLTPVGQFAQAFIAEKVKGNRFVVKTNKPGVEVSWQVTGIRHDAFANAHRIRVEAPKPAQERNR
jgi:hypothetical protein